MKKKPAKNHPFRRPVLSKKEAEKIVVYSIRSFSYGR